MRTAAAAAGFLVMALAGCGGARGERHLPRRRRIDRPPPEHQGAEFVAAVAPLWDEQADAVAALAPPPELAQDADAYLGALDFLLRSLVETRTAAKRGDESGRVSAALKTVDAAAEARTKAAALGLAACTRQRIA